MHLELSKITLTTLAVSALAPFLLFGPAAGSDDTFGYTCEDCPSNWANLDVASNSCGGSDQSPIAFSRKDARSKRRLPRLRVDYSDFVGLAKEELATNVEYKDETPGENSLTLDGETYTFVQFHFHSAAEHVLNGNRSPLELHFVHQSGDGDLLVLGVFIKEGDRTNEAFESITSTIGDAAVPDGSEVDVELASLPPRKLASFRYTGSTTTPPCSGGVQWILLKQQVALSTEQIEAIQTSIRDINDGFDNNRPIQNRDDRIVKMDPRRGSDDDDNDEDD